MLKNLFKKDKTMSHQDHTKESLNELEQENNPPASENVEIQDDLQDATTENMDFEEEATPETLFNFHDQLMMEKIELEAQIADLKDKYIRLHAEFDNFKKRNVKERLELVKTASRDTLSALLPVLDDFDRAKQNAERNTETAFSDGIQLVYNKLFNTLEQKGLKPMESTGQLFDPDLHAALTEIPAPTEEMKGKIIDTVERGYYLNDVLIRHAKVVVGS